MATAPIKANVTSSASTVKMGTEITLVPEGKVIDPKRLRDTMSETLWTVVGLEDCQWTKKTIDLLQAHGEKYRFVPINMEWQRRLLVEFGTRRVPAIFQNHKLLGSFDVLEAYYKCSFITETEGF